MIAVTPYQFIFKSIEPVIDMSNYPAKVFSRVVIKDDIFSMFPYMEVHLQDEGAIIVDGIISAEGYEFVTQLGSNDKDFSGWVETKWIWRNNQTVNIQIKDNVGGLIGMAFQHKYKALDSPKQRGWEDTLSNITKSVIREDYGFIDVKKMYIADTAGRAIRRQAGQSNEFFLHSLCKKAYSRVYEYSPYLCFFNAKEEFFFCPIEYLFKRGKKVSNTPYKVATSLDASHDKFSFQKIEDISTLGLSKNKPNFKINISKFSDDYISETTDIENHVLNGEINSKLLINKTYKNSFSQTDTFDYGIYTKAEDEDYRGKRNSLYLNNLLNFRIQGIVPFNAEIASGRIMPLAVGSYSIKKGEKSKELSGDWLILKNKIFYDTDGVPYNVVTLGKKAVAIDSTYMLKSGVI
jgi:hypothetical protein